MHSHRQTLDRRNTQNRKVMSQSHDADIVTSPFLPFPTPHPRSSATPQPRTCVPNVTSPSPCQCALREILERKQQVRFFTGNVTNTIFTVLPELKFQTSCQTVFLRTIPEQRATSNHRNPGNSLAEELVEKKLTTSASNKHRIRTWWKDAAVHR